VSIIALFSPNKSLFERQRKALDSYLSAEFGNFGNIYHFLDDSVSGNEFSNIVGNNKIVVHKLRRPENFPRYKGPRDAEWMDKHEISFVESAYEDMILCCSHFIGCLIPEENYVNFEHFDTPLRKILSMYKEFVVVFPNGNIELIKEWEQYQEIVFGKRLKELVHV
jgi:hypothetical protein